MARIVWRPRALKAAKNLDQRTLQRIDKALVRFAKTGHGDVVKMKDKDPPEWRLRVGGYRVRFSLGGGVLEVLHAGPRGDVYRR